MYLSKSKYCTGIQCKKILWLDKNNPEVREDVSNQAVLDNGTEVGELAKGLFGKYVNVNYCDDLKTMIKDTKSLLLMDRIIITEASFEYENNFCSVDILVKNKDRYEMYEVKSSTEVSDVYLDDISYQYYVLTSLGYDVKKACIVHLNSDYERIGELELDKLFTIEDVTSIAKEKQEEVVENIKDINKYMDEVTEPLEDLGMHCFSPYECPYFKFCSNWLPEHNVFNIRGMRTSSKVKFYEEEKFKYEDLLNEKLNEKYREQIEFELYNKEDKIDKQGIKEFLDTLTYPLYFLDFETYQQAIPQYDHVKPYMQIPFQYSLHILDREDGKLEHLEFLAKADIDPRRELALRLVKDIPDNVCVLAYNMSFEKRVIKDLAEIFPDLKDHLMKIHNNIKDLMIPFKDRCYYTKDMEGSYSIKYVLPALYPDDPSLDYHNLELVHNGSEAMNSYATLGELSKKEQEHVRERLLRYCELDTYAMVKIYEKLLNVIKDV